MTKIERPWVCLLALVVIVCVAATMPVLADHVATSSEHTTDSDFSNAQTLDNLTIQGTGDDARLELRPEDKPDSVARPDDTSSNDVTAERGIKVQTGNSPVHSLTVHRSSNTGSGTRTYRLRDSSFNEIENVSTSSTSASFSTTLDPNSYYYVTLDRDGLSYTSGYAGSLNFPYEGDGLDIVAGRDQNGDNDVAAYNIKSIDYEYAETDPGHYVSATHDASNVEEGYVNLQQDGTTADITWQAHDGSQWVTVNSTTTSASGETTTPLSGGYTQWRVDVQFSAPGDSTADLTSEGVRSSSSPPQLDNSTASPSGGENVTDSPVTLQIDVADADFATTQGDTVEIEWYHNGAFVGTTTHSQNETASIESDEGVGGTNEWYAVATDEQGHETTSRTFTFESPSELEIRDVHTGELINTSEVHVQFYHSGDVVVEETTTDGKVDLSGVGAETEILVDADADDYYPRSIIIESIWEQQKVYLLNSTDSSVDAVQPRFRLNDPSGQFVESESDLFIERPLNHSGNGSEWIVVAGDEFGAEGYTVWLEQGVRYRLVLRNEAGDRRTVGSYRPTATETIELEVEGIQYEFQMEEVNVEYSIEYDGDVQEVQFAYKDHDGATETLNLEIYEQGNKSNTIANESFSPGNDITYAIVANNTTNWVVEFNADRGADHEDVSEVRVVGETHLDIGPDLDPRWSTVAGMGMLIVVGGLFGRGRPEIGAIAVSVLGGILWLIGWMPGATTGAMVVVALFVSILYYARGGGAR